MSVLCKEKECVNAHRSVLVCSVNTYIDVSFQNISLVRRDACNTFQSVLFQYTWIQLKDAEPSNDLQMTLFRFARLLAFRYDILPDVIALRPQYAVSYGTTLNHKQSDQFLRSDLVRSPRRQ